MAGGATEVARLGVLGVCRVGCVESPGMVNSVCGPCIITWRCRVMFSVRVAETTTSGGV